ncbi:TlpA disulfide reductase family protein [Flavihumibacter sp. ZG627]|uniref:TlpA family protein disulfide reductase n=1 Tax=Flavihumibacter sp. ZG627 TaxID=1463156 RepID=UPI000694B73A|nr:TlpA disulfide reductase family protein [Flavihumibacter sp. ZG627]
MTIQNIYAGVRKHLVDILLVGFLLLIIFNPGAKSWMLKQLVSIGLFKAEIKKEGINSNPEKTSFAFTDAAGNSASLEDLKGKVVFINFWATWCPPCVAEMPSLEALYSIFKDDERIVFLFMNEDDDKAKAIKYLQKNSYTMPLSKAAGIVPKEVYSGTLPTTVILNKEGKVVLKKEGLANYNTDAFIKQLEEVL